MADQKDAEIIAARLRDLRSAFMDAGLRVPDITLHIDSRSFFLLAAAKSDISFVDKETAFFLGTALVREGLRDA